MRLKIHPALRLNWLAKSFGKQLLDQIPYPEEDQIRLKKLSEDGVVIYIHRSRGLVWHLALGRAIAQNSLPPIYFTGGLKTAILRPWFGLSRFFRGREKRAIGTGPIQEAQLEHCLNKGRAAEIFLRKPFTLLSEGAEVDLLATLVNIQKTMQKPIFLVPHVLVFRAEPSRFEPTTADLVFGTNSEPGFLRSLTRVFLSKNTSRFEVCKELNLLEYIQESSTADPSLVAKKVRNSMFSTMDHIERVCHGPPLKSHARMKSETLGDPHLQQFLNQAAKTTGIGKSKYNQKANKYFQEIAARFDMDITRIIDRVLRVIWNRIYDGLIWDKSDIEKLRKKAHQGPLIITPSHRSHVDYLVMSQLLYWEGLMPPHIAAGNNLSFFPLGWILRRGGAYFIRRSFKGDPLYPEVVQAYLTRLLKEGFTQEFFIEGGRSRTGKTLSPKYGLLTMMIQSIINSKAKDAIFVPASISYEKLVEEQSYTRELQGGEKKAETTRNILGSAKILRKRYGKVFVTFDEPVSFREFLDERGLTLEELKNENTLKDTAKSFAHRIVFGINRCSIVTPTSLIVAALFTAPRRTMARPVLLRTAKALIEYIKINTGELARFDPNLLSDPKTQIDRALSLLIRDKLISHEEAGRLVYYRIPEQSALALDYYKNNIVNHFIADAIIATAFVAKGGAKHFTVSESDLFNATQLLSQILKREFIFPVGQTYEEIFAARIAHAEKTGLLSKTNRGYRLVRTRGASRRLNFAVLMIANFIDAYLICALRIKNEAEHSSNLKTLTLGLLGRIRGAFLDGTVDCPEAASKAIVQNAISLFSDLNIITIEGDEPKFVGEQSDQSLLKMTELLRRSHYNRLTL